MNSDSGIEITPPANSGNGQDARPFLIVDARVRYWEDAEINGENDTEEGDRIPLKEGESWKPIIDLANGKILNWPEGITADIHYKVCDDGDYWLGDANGNKRLKWRGGYVPNNFLCMGDSGYGDYIILRVGTSGQITEWSFPVIDFDEWEPVTQIDQPAMDAEPPRQQTKGE